MSDDRKTATETAVPGQATKEEPATRPPAEEIGGPEGAEPIRFGDWEKAGCCSDF